MLGGAQIFHPKTTAPLGNFGCFYFQGNSRVSVNVLSMPPDLFVAASEVQMGSQSHKLGECSNSFFCL